MLIISEPAWFSERCAKLLWTEFHPAIEDIRFGKIRDTLKLCDPASKARQHLFSYDRGLGCKRMTRFFYFYITYNWCILLIKN